MSEIRERIDAVDRRIVQLLVERSALVGEVVHYKQVRTMPVVDRQREDEMLEHIETVAAGEGLDSRVAHQVLRAVIDAFTLLEVEQLGHAE